MSDAGHPTPILVLLDLNVIIHAEARLRDHTPTSISASSNASQGEWEMLREILSTSENRRRYQIAVSMSSAGEEGQGASGLLGREELYRRLANCNLADEDLRFLEAQPDAVEDILRILAPCGSKNQLQDARLISDLVDAGGGIFLTEDKGVRKRAVGLEQMGVRVLSLQEMRDEVAGLTRLYGSPPLVAYERGKSHRIRGEVTLLFSLIPPPCNCPGKHLKALVEVRTKDQLPCTMPGIYTVTTFDRLGVSGPPVRSWTMTFWTAPYRRKGQWVLRGRTHSLEHPKSGKYEGDPCRTPIPAGWARLRVHFSPDGDRTACGLNAKRYRSTVGPLAVVDCRNCLKVIACPERGLTLAVQQRGARLLKTTWVCWICEEDFAEEHYDLVEDKVTYRRYMAQAYRKRWQSYRDREQEGRRPPLSV